jgi:type VI secretion system secreted protein VgrG
LFCFEADVVPSDPLNFDPARMLADSLIGHEGIIELSGDYGSEPRFIHGLISWFAALPIEEISAAHVYRMRLVPWLALWNLNTTCRMFSSMTAPEIAQYLIGEWTSAYDLALREGYETREYRCQYEETDFNFFSRILEEEGIFYYFRHSAGEHRLVLADKTAFEVLSGPPSATYGYSVTHWSAEYAVHSGRYTVRDFDEARAELVEGSEATLVPLAANERLHHFRHPAATPLLQEARRRARIGIEREECRHALYHGASTRRDFCAAGKFSLQEHPDERFNVEYLITSVEHTFDLERGYRNTFTCIPYRSDIVYRPPRTAARPRVHGPQTAIVVEEPPDIDQRGAVRVQFHWSDIPSRCWVRFAEMSAGQSWGTWFPPRVGQEVIVEFLHGDPDRPVITGRLYNGRNTPPAIEPYVTLIKTSGGQELRFEDQDGQERLVLKATKDLEIRSEKGEITIQDGSGNRIHISPSGISVASPGSVKVEASQVAVTGGMVTVDAGLTRAKGVLQCDVLLANAVVSASYTPGAGNIW